MNILGQIIGYYVTFPKAYDNGFTLIIFHILVLIISKTSMLTPRNVYFSLMLNAGCDFALGVL